MPNLHQELAGLFGYAEFRPHQENVIRAILAGQDSFTVMPTGGGKSLCYQLPARLLPGVCLVVSPLISLMKDQVDAAKATGLRAIAFNSASSSAERAAARAGLRDGSLDLVYISPERLGAPEFMDLLRGAKISFFAIDEAHCISQWGHDFRPDYLGLSCLKALFPDKPAAAFTATATRRVQNDIIERLGLLRPLCTRASFNRPNLAYRISPKTDLGRQLLTFLAENAGPGIIYRATRKEVEHTCEFLNRHHIQALPYHAGLPDETRQANQEAFRQDHCPLLVATIAFGMGIDKPNVRFVLHGDLPKSLEAYYQETGRAGRDNDPAQCVMFYGRKDIGLLTAFARRIEDEEARAAALAQTYAMADFTQKDACRRKGLLAYFGETYPEDNCGACDVCLGEVEREDALIPAQKLLSAMVRTGQRFGGGYVADIVLGKATPRILANGHDRLPTFGCGAGQKADYWRRVLDALLAQGCVAATDEAYPTLWITEKGRQVLRGEASFSLLKAAERARSRAERRARGLEDAAETAPENPELYERLRELRQNLARQAGLPAYLVFPDRTLRELARRKPVLPENLLAIPGVGNYKLGTYGPAFLQAIRQWRIEQGEDLPCLEFDAGEPPCRLEPPGAVAADEPPEPGKTLLETAALVERGLSLSEIVEARGLKTGSILRHLDSLAQAGHIFRVDQFMKPERFAYLKELFAGSGGFALAPVVERSRLNGARPAGQAPADFEEARLARILMHSEGNRTDGA